MSYNPNPEARKQVLDALAELGRPVSHYAVADHLRVTPETARKRLQGLWQDKLITKHFGEKCTVLWSLGQTSAKNTDRFTRHSPVTALPPLEQAVQRWLRKASVQGGLNGR